MLEYLVSGSLTVTCLVGLTAGLLGYWLIQKWKYNYPPGPRGLPLLGNLLQIDQSRLHEQAFEWSKKYGPVITVNVGPTPFVYVNKIDEALEVLVKKSTDFASRMRMPSLDVFTFGGKNIAFGDIGPSWKLRRRIASKALRYYMQGDALENRIHDAVQTAFVEIDKQTGEFDPLNYLSFISGNIVMGLCFGGKYAFDDKSISYVLDRDEEFFKLIGDGILEDFIPGLRFVYKSKGFKKMEQLTEEIMEQFTRAKFNEAKRTFDKNNIRHFTDTLILARDEAVVEEGEEVLSLLTDDHLVQTVAGIFFAGVDTARFTLGFAINHMIAFPDIQEKVQEEIDRVVGKDRMPGLADRPNLAYTEAVLHESMRLSVVVPTGILHMTSCDAELAGYRLPKGTTVAVNHWALHHDPEAWEDVDRFIPERFLDDDGKLGPKPKNWLPFSAGKRVCLGEFVAKPKLHLIFAALMQRYKWKMVSGKCADLTARGNSFGQQSNPYKVIVEKRI